MSSKQQTKGKGGTWKMLGVLALAAGLLAGYHRFSHAREVAVVTGPPSQQQEQFFASAADRPDIVQFFENLTPQERLSMARNLSRHDDPKVANLIGLLLPTFDVQAREALNSALVSLAPKQPEAVSMELKHVGSFQRIAVFKALRSLGAAAIPIVAERLGEAATKANATSFLVETGEAAIPALMTKLSGENKDARLAAAEALSKLRAKTAVSKLTDLYLHGAPDEKPVYLVALATTGDPSSEAILTEAFQMEALPPHLRSQAALGLGRVGSSAAVKLLWQSARSSDPAMRDASTTALKLAGDAALASAPTEDPALLASVLEGIRTPKADTMLQNLLRTTSGKTQRVVVGAMAGREQLIPTLQTLLRGLSVDEDGEMIDVTVAALAATNTGRQVLGRMSNGDFKAVIERRLALAHETT